MDVSDITGSGYDVVKQVPVLRPGMHPGSLSLVALLKQCVMTRPNSEQRFSRRRPLLLAFPRPCFPMTEYYCTNSTWQRQLPSLNAGIASCLSWSVHRRGLVHPPSVCQSSTCATQLQSIVQPAAKCICTLTSADVGWCRQWNTYPLVSCRNYPAVCFLFLVHSLSCQRRPWSGCIYRQRPRCSYSCLANCVMLFRHTPPALSPLSIRHRRLLPFPGGVTCALKTRLRQLCPGRASSILAAAPPVCSQRCGSSDVAPKSLRSCIGRPCNSILAASTSMSRLQGRRHGISCAAWSHATIPEWSCLCCWPAWSSPTSLVIITSIDGSTIPAHNR